MRFVRSARPQGKDVLVRVDFNVPEEKGKITDDFRIRSAWPIVQFLKKKRAKKIILISHRGRPQAKDRNNPSFSLAPVAVRLEELTGEKIYFTATAVGQDLKKEIAALPAGSVVLLENLRFYREEDKNNRRFARSLAGLADIFVNDAFAVCHRQTASLSAIADFMPAYAGISLENELSNLRRIMVRPSKPVVVVLGGAKIKDKIAVIEKLSNKAGSFLLGGMMANTFCLANGFAVGKSLYNKDALKIAGSLRSGKANLVLPGDFRVLDARGRKVNRELGLIRPTDKILDIGPAAENYFSRIIASARTVFFNGPLGKFEDAKFRDGTAAVVEAIWRNKQMQAVIGGGDTLAAWQKLRPQYDASNSKRLFFSAGGGAMLKYIAGEPMPGLLALDKNKN